MSGPIANHAAAVGRLSTALPVSPFGTASVPRVKALRRLTVRAAYPAELAKLGDIVANLRWSWHADSLDLLESVDPELWRSCGHDPGRMLGEVSAERFAAAGHATASSCAAWRTSTTT